MVKLPLGQSVAYPEEFDPGVLFRIPRAAAREMLGIKEPLPFDGVDRWTCYELSWLGPAGVPEVGIAVIEYPASSPHIVESKSLKLFLGSLAFTEFDSVKAVETAIASALTHLFEGVRATAVVSSVEAWGELKIAAPPGESIDRGTPSAGVLRAGAEIVTETVHSNLLRSLCPVTGQPDWGTLVVRYSGRRLDRGALLSYLIEHRRYQGFHEECCERIFTELARAIEPDELWVGSYYTRRGGIDINPERWLPGSRRPEMSGRLARQ